MQQPANSVNKSLTPKKNIFFRYFLRIFKWVGLAVVLGLLFLLLIVFFYSEEVKVRAVQELNKHLNTEVKINPKDIEFTLISTFPNAAIQFKNVIVYEALQKKIRDTILNAGLISLQFNVLDLFNEKYNIKKILISDVKINFITDKNGQHNFIFWKENNEIRDLKKDSSVQELKFELQRIDFKNLEFSYKNKKEFIKIKGQSKSTYLTGSFSETNFLLGANGEFFIDELILNKRSFLTKKNVNLSLEADVKGKDWSLRNSSIAINQLNILAKGSLTKIDSNFNCDLLLEGKDVDVKSVISLLPDNQKEKIADYESSGNFYFKALLNGKLNSFNLLNVDVKFGIDRASIKHIPSSSMLTNVNLNGQYTKLIGGKDVLTFDDISAAMNSNFIKGSCKLTDLSEPFIEINSSLSANLDELIKFYPIDTVKSITGKLNLNLAISSMLKDLKSNFSGQTEIITGDARVADIELLFKNSSAPIKIKSGDFIINQNDLLMKNVSINPEENDLLVNGELNNFIAWLLKENEQLNITGTVKSNYINVEKILAMFSIQDSSSNLISTKAVPLVAKDEVNISDKFNLDLTVSFAKTIWGKFEAENITGKIKVKEKKIYAEDLSFKSFGGDVHFSCLVDASGDSIIFKGVSELNAINVNTMFTQLNNFNQDVIKDKHLKGLATFSIDFNTIWNKQLVCDLSSIKLSSDLLIEKGELIQYKALEALSKYVEISELRNIKFSTLTSHIAIKNKQIMISKTEVHSSAMNISLEGTHSFTNEIDYRFSILMSELLARKPGKSKEIDDELRFVENDPENKRTVFIRMTGTLDYPKFNYDRKAAKEKIKEDIKNEKKNLKQILKEEFGWFKKDTTLTNTINEKNKKADQKFNIEFGQDKKSKEKLIDSKKEEVRKKKKEENSDDDDF